MRQVIHGITYDTAQLTPWRLWCNHRPPNHPDFQRYFVYRQSVDRYVIWVRTGMRRGGLDQLVLLDHAGLEALYQATMPHDHRRSLARVLAALPQPA